MQTMDRMRQSLDLMFLIRMESHPLQKEI